MEWNTLISSGAISSNQEYRMFFYRRRAANRLGRFISWLREQNPNRTYYYWSRGICAHAQFSEDEGERYSVSLLRPGSITIESVAFGGATRCNCETVHTFGAALRRAEVAYEEMTGELFPRKIQAKAA